MSYQFSSFHFLINWYMLLLYNSNLISALSISSRRIIQFKSCLRKPNLKVVSWKYLKNSWRLLLQKKIFSTLSSDFRQFFKDILWDILFGEKILLRIWVIYDRIRNDELLRTLFFVHLEINNFDGVFIFKSIIFIKFNCILVF